ncbi:MAG: N-acetylmuramoyl-L-alanine amidase [bacterium]|nr:N-acetylmuramoyl-L-alanine amidase [bacterium]
MARLRTSRAGKLALRWLLAALVASQVAAGPVQAQDIEPGPPGSGVIVTDSGLVLPVREAQDGGFRVTTTCWREGFVSSGTYLGSVDVVLDPGHGGSEYGAIGSNGLSEKELNLSVAQMAATELRAHGYSVLLTRTTDVRMPVVVRSEIARAVDPDVFVSIHHNGGAVRRSSSPGTETYHQAHNPDSARLGGILYERIHSALSQYGITWRVTGLRGANAIVRRRDGKDLYGILQYTPGLTSVITEAAYLSNPAEARLLADPDAQETEALAIAHGIIQYLTTESPGSGYNGTVVTSRRLRGGSPGGCVDPPLGAESLPDSTSLYKDVTPGEETSAIEALASQGVLSNTDCGPALFCPDGPVQRWVMAVWLVRTLDSDEPEPIEVSRFADIDVSKWWAPYVDRLAALGITQGCSTSPARFCPHDYVRRDQMATFAVRAFQLGGGPASDHIDTIGNPHSVNINAATTAGVVGDCATNPARYCPHLPTSRGETAALLHRATETPTTKTQPPSADKKGNLP